MINHTRHDKSAGRYRTQKTLTYLHEFTRTIWLGRNDALHRDKETAETIIYSVESAEIRHYHTNPQLIPASNSPLLHQCNSGPPYSKPPICSSPMAPPCSTKCKSRFLTRRKSTDQYHQVSTTSPTARSHSISNYVW